MSERKERDNGIDHVPRTGLSDEQIEERSELAAYVASTDFPANKAALLSRAQGLDAPRHVIESLEQLDPADTFENVNDVWIALGNEDEPTPNHSEMENDWPHDGDRITEEEKAEGLKHLR